MMPRPRLALIAAVGAVAAAPAAALAAPKGADDDRPLRRPELTNFVDTGAGLGLSWDKPADWIVVIRVYGRDVDDRKLARTVRSDEMWVEVPIPGLRFHHLTIRWRDPDSGRRSRLQRVDYDDMLGMLVVDIDDDDPDDQADAADD